MTPLQFARAECSNHHEDGSCQGLGIKDDGSIYSFGSKPKCVVGLDQRCQFFEDCVIPIGTELTSARNVQVAKDRDEARKQYRRDSNAPMATTLNARACPQCNKRSLEKAKRLCYVCREGNRKQNNRERARKHRNGSGT